MKSHSVFIFAVLVLAISAPALLRAQSAGCDLLLLHASDDSVQLAAEFFTPVGYSIRLEAIYVVLAYDPSTFTVSNNSVMNHRFAAAGFQKDSDPKLDTNQNAPDLCMYGESHPNFGTIPYPANTRRQLCTFKMIPKAPGPGVTSFYVYGNQVAPAYSGYWIDVAFDNQPFNPMNDLNGIDWPVEFTLFNAVQQGKAVALKWITAREIGNAGFHVERRLDGSSEWSDLGFVKGHGTTRHDVQYLFVDRTLEAAGNYEYRLRQVDMDGTHSYSSIALVEYRMNAEGYALDAVYPNPIRSSEFAVLRYTLPQRSTVVLTVSDALGREVARIADRTADAGNYTAQWNPSELPAGSYVATLHAQNETGTVAFRKSVRIAVAH